MREIEGIKFYTVLELSKKLQTTPETIRKYIRENRIKATKVGVNFLISHKELMRFLGEPEDEVRNER
jgi:excisionase family DNA binding protein